MKECRVEFNGYFPQEFPEVISKNLDEIEQFARVSVVMNSFIAELSQDLHEKILDPLHVLFALALELPENYFTDLHKYSLKSEDHLRYMKYSKFSPENQEKLLAADGLYSQGHTDLGTITLLFRQPVAALQIKDHATGEWKWAKPLNSSLTVNTCDALSFLTGGYVKSTIHRVS